MYIASVKQSQTQDLKVGLFKLQSPLLKTGASYAKLGYQFFTLQTLLLGVTVGGAHAFLSSSLVLISFSVSVFLFLAFGGSIL